MPDVKVIVIDPGHGGENLGLTYNGFIEKEMTLSTATYLKTELEKYDNVEVYITNSDMRDMSLKERAEYAKSVEADVLISLHFNMSENHTLFGSEVWVPSSGLGNSKMHAFGDVFLEEFEHAGILSRGVKCRLNDDADDYYGIIREAATLRIPAMIVEHCHADHAEDVSFLNSETSLSEFGKMDATAIAKYYGLSSTELSVNYSDYAVNGYFAPESAVGLDDTPPTDVSLHFVDTKQQKEGSQNFFVVAKDPESKLTYYDYSLDGGNTFSELKPWKEHADGLEITIPDILLGSKVCVRVYNGNTKASTKSNSIVFGEKLSGEETTQIEDTYEAYRQTKLKESEQAKLIAQKGGNGLIISGIVSSVFLFAFAAFLGTIALKANYHKKKKKATGFTISAILLIMISVASAVFLFQMGIEKKEKLMAELETVTISDNQLEIMLQDERNEKVEAAINAFSAEDTISQDAINEVLSKEKESVLVYDIAEGYLKVDALESVSENEYDFTNLQNQGGIYSYQDPAGIPAKFGIDVSKYQGDINWQQVKEAGVSFAMIRLGVRGYGTGALVLDDKFKENVEGATAAGIPVGVYFFSAAVSVSEAEEEAAFVLANISGYPITYPVVFDTEPVYQDIARNEAITPNQLTEFTVAFCEKIRQNGYQPMIYANAKRLTTALHLEKVSQYPIWYADYQEKPIFPYAYDMWQYSEKGSISGVEGLVDFNLYFK